MNVESSRVIDMFTDAGSALRTDANFCFTPSMTATVFSPVARTISSVTAGVPFSQAALLGRSKPSSA